MKSKVRGTQTKLTDFKPSQLPKKSYNRKGKNRVKLSVKKEFVVVEKSNEEEVKKLKQIIKDLTTNQNERLLAKITLKTTGFSPKEFYEKFVYTARGPTPDVGWSKDENVNKIRYQEALRVLEKERRLTNMFYHSKEWVTRSAEILKRDKHQCECCKRKTNRVHHRASATYNPEMCLNPNNLVTMCKKCEDEIHNR